MSEAPPDVSIILLTYDGQPYLDEVLTGIFTQRTQFRFEVLAIDSGSVDRTVEIIRKYPVRLHQIPNSEFGHGKTRNLGAKLAAGRYLVFLTQDATPAHESWLENVVSAVAEDPRVAGAYSRQIPRRDCNPVEWRDIERGAGTLSMVKKVNFCDEFQRKVYEVRYREFIVFSNVSSCIRKDILERIPFNEDLVMVEDQEWCKKAIEAGYATAYEARSAVYHSHNFPLKAIYKRHFDYGASYREFAALGLTLAGVIFYTVYETFSDIVFIAGQCRNLLWKLKWIVKSPVIRFVMRYGFYKGLRGSRQ